MIRFPPLRPVAALVILCLAIAVLVCPTGLAAQNREVVHYQKNMKFDMTDQKRLAGDILARRPDTVTLQEVNGDNRDVLKWLRPQYPWQKICHFDEIGRVAVMARWPVVAGTEQCLRGQGIAAMQVEMPEGKVWVMSVHLETPDKPLHRLMVQNLVPELARFRGPKIIAGDFNAFPGSASVSALAQAAGVTELGPRIITYRVANLLGFTIDHVMVTGGSGRVEQLPLIGSDHFGVLAHITLRF
ncbi:MAG: endonuclease/exonuclease/phosphatase family protein [Maritimibacter sp.]|nr:endonuclease/exonuclease/phosphatase family protein [Maritimibacter sp.]